MNLAHVIVLDMNTTSVNITTRQVAVLAHVDPSTVRRWVEQGKLTPSIVTPGGQFRFEELAVKEQLKFTVKALAAESQEVA